MKSLQPCRFCGEKFSGKLCPNCEESRGPYGVGIRPDGFQRAPLLLLAIPFLLGVVPIFIFICYLISESSYVSDWRGSAFKEAFLRESAGKGWIILNIQYGGRYSSISVKHQDRPYVFNCYISNYEVSNIYIRENDELSFNPDKEIIVIFGPDKNVILKEEVKNSDAYKNDGNFMKAKAQELYGMIQRSKG